VFVQIEAHKHQVYSVDTSTLRSLFWFGKSAKRMRQRFSSAMTVAVTAGSHCGILNSRHERTLPVVVG